MNTKRNALAFAAALATLLAIGSAFAIERDTDGYFHTGEGIRAKTIVFVNLKIYFIGHEMRELPSTKSKQAVIDADVDKRIWWKMLRDAGGAPVSLTGSDFMRAT